MDKDQTYKVFVLCKNCSFRGEIEVEKGLLVEEKKCPDCGCIKLARDYNAEHRQDNTRDSRDSYNI